MATRSFGNPAHAVSSLANIADTAATVTNYKWNQSSYDAHQVSVVASLRF